MQVFAPRVPYIAWFAPRGRRATASGAVGCGPVRRIRACDERAPGDDSGGWSRPRPPGSRARCPGTSPRPSGPLGLRGGARGGRHRRRESLNVQNCGAPMRFVPCGGAGGFRGDAGDVACRALGYAALKPEDTPCPVPPGGPSERPPKPCSPEDCCEKHPEDPVAQIPSSTTLKAHSHTHTAQEGPCPLPSGHRAMKSGPFCSTYHPSP